MAIEPRKPPSQFIPKLQRTLGGRAGWSGFVLQLLFVAALAWISYEIVANARANLQAQRITAGFGFLANNAGFDVSQSLIPYSGSDPYTRVFLVGLLNTLLVSVIGIFFATLIGFIVALGRLSPNWLLSRISGGSLPGGVSWPASHRRTLLALLTDSLWAMTEPAEPPPTMIVSYTLVFPFGWSWQGSAPPPSGHPAGATPADAHRTLREAAKFA